MSSTRCKRLSPHTSVTIHSSLWSTDRCFTIDPMTVFTQQEGNKKGGASVKQTRHLTRSREENKQTKSVTFLRQRRGQYQRNPVKTPRQHFPKCILRLLVPRKAQPRTGSTAKGSGETLHAMSLPLPLESHKICYYKKTLRSPAEDWCSYFKPSGSQNYSVVEILRSAGIYKRSMELVFCRAQVAAKAAEWGWVEEGSPGQEWCFRGRLKTAILVAFHSHDRQCHAYRRKEAGSSSQMKFHL